MPPRPRSVSGRTSWRCPGQSAPRSPATSPGQRERVRSAHVMQQVPRGQSPWWDREHEYMYVCMYVYMYIKVGFYQLGLQVNVRHREGGPRWRSIAERRARQTGCAAPAHPPSPPSSRIHTVGIRKGGGRGEGNSPAAARPCPRTALRWARSPPCRATSSKENQWNENQWGKVMYLHGQTDGGNNLPLWKFSAIRSQKEPRSRLRVFVTYNECAALHLTHHH